MADDLDFDSPGTGSGGNEFTGYSSSGIYSSPAVRASDDGDGGSFGRSQSFSNVSGGPGVNYVNDKQGEYQNTVEAGRNYNQLNQPKFGLAEYTKMKQDIWGNSLGTPSSAAAPSSPSSGGGGGGGGGVFPGQNVGGTGMSYDQLRSMATDSEIKKMLGLETDEKKSGGSSSGGRGGGGGGGGVRKGGGGLGSLLPDPTAGMYDVKPNPLPFQPIIPTPGSGMKRAFFSAQEDLLKAMAPYWLQQFK